MNSFNGAAPIYMLMAMLALQAAKMEFLCAIAILNKKLWRKTEISIDMKKSSI